MYTRQQNVKQMKTKNNKYCDVDSKSRERSIQEGGKVLVRQRQTEKSISACESNAMIVTECKGSMITTTDEGRTVTRNSSDFKKLREGFDLRIKLG